MYAGSTFTNFSGTLLGTHQKFDRKAHKYLLSITDCKPGFPVIKDILHFEGKDGPDGIKRKSPGKDEPWHFYDPFDEYDNQLIGVIHDHYSELVKELKKGNPERAAFDAAWLAHAIVDGLTPAHHYPYEKKLTELMGGGLEERNSLKNKVIIPADTAGESVKKNWALWGIGGLISTHTLFEGGVAAILGPVSLKTSMPIDSDIQLLIDVGYEEYFKRSAREIALLNMFERFIKKGWRLKLIREVRNELAPTIVKTVCLTWFSAMRDAGLLRGKR